MAQAKAKEYVSSNQPKDSPHTPLHQELLVTIAGPLSHVPQALFWLGLYLKLGGGGHPLSLEIDMDNLKEGGVVTFVSTVAMQALVMNIVMFKLNLIMPVHPFPGGRALVALLVMCGANLSTAGLVTATMGILMGLVAFWSGFILLLMNYTVIAICLGALSFYTIFAGVRLLRMTWQGNAQHHVLFQRPCYQLSEESRKEALADDGEEDSISIAV